MSRTLSENLRYYTKAIYGFDHVVRLGQPGDWDRPSPCTGWTARHVLGHVNAIQRYYEDLIAGRPPSMNPMEEPDRHAGDDPAATWAATRDAVLTTLDRPGVLAQVVTTHRGDEAVDSMIGFNMADTTIHSWDLARALGVDDRLDESLVARSIELLEPVAEQLRGPWGFADTVPLDEGTDPQARLLAMVGRTS